MSPSEKFYKRIFAIAAIYNILWGTVVVLYPTLFFEQFNLEQPNYPFLMSGIGMFVAVYGYGYWIVSKDPIRYPQLIVIGLLGKTLGPIGWAYHVMIGNLPFETMWVNVFNDIIWIPFFVSYLIWQRKAVLKFEIRK